MRSNYQCEHGINSRAPIVRPDGLYTPQELLHNQAIEEIQPNDEEAYQEILRQEENHQEQLDYARLHEGITPPEDHAVLEQAMQQKRAIRR
jgi:hypothetical protein